MPPLRGGWSCTFTSTGAKPSRPAWSTVWTVSATRPRIRRVPPPLFLSFFLFRLWSDCGWRMLTAFFGYLQLCTRVARVTDLYHNAEKWDR